MLLQPRGSAPRVWPPTAMRSPVSARLVLAVAVLLSALGCTDAALPWCGSRVDGLPPLSPAVSVPRVSLGWLNSTDFDAAACSLSFEQFTAAHSDWVTCYHAPVFNVHTCPQHCLRAANDTVAVYGSFPYDEQSSVCLAAIHAGVINESSGGAVLLDRFYPERWTVTEHRSSAGDSDGGPRRAVRGSGSTSDGRRGEMNLSAVAVTPSPSSSRLSPSSSPSLSPAAWFPHRSWQGSASFGVQSRAASQLQAVDADSGAGIGPSWTVRGRGLQPRQRQLAPFSPRAGHLHAWLYPELQLRANWSTGLLARSPTDFNYRSTLNYSLHFVIGGHNDTHYMNDVSHRSSRQLSTPTLRCSTRLRAVVDSPAVSLARHSVSSLCTLPVCCWAACRALSVRVV